MRTLLLVVAMVFMGQMAYAEPFLTSDANPTAEVYRTNLLSAGFDNEISPADIDGAVLVDLANVPIGSHTEGTIETGAEWVLNGVPQGIWEWSATVPLELTRPGPTAVTGIAIAP